MARDKVIAPETFDEILAWLHPDREAAGEIYVQLRHGLAKIFSWNKCADPEGLTDETFDRVGQKVAEVRPTYKGDPKHYFYGVARNLVRESPKRARKQVVLEEARLSAVEPEVLDESANMREDCLESCLQKLPEEKRALIIRYYTKEKQAKIDHRVEIASELGISVKALRVRLHRLRGAIITCVEACMNRIEQ